ncbi:MAG: ABC transporter ATP-binding protein [Chloroflexota bacterium]|nr:MAG: sulfonate ABC transporter ATP-binding protein [Chloroflexota bacterium]
MSVVRIQEVSYTYPGPPPIEALRDITVEARDREFISVIGPSGSGKSTLLRLVADLLPPSSGRVLIDDAPAHRARANRSIGFVFQEPALMPWRSSEKNVHLPLEIVKRAKSDDSSSPERLLALVGLQDFKDKRPDQLSGGMRQRVSIARALTYKPRLLLMDEPFGALDQITRDDMNQELLKIWEQTEATILFVTHSLSEAIYLSDHVVVLSTRPGRIVDIVHPPFGRPREPGIKRTDEFFEMETRVLSALEGGGTRA